MADKIPSRIKQLLSLAQRALFTAQGNLVSGDLRATVNRAYYAIFYAASAVLLTKGVEPRTHSDAIRAFRAHLVKSDLIETEYSHMYGEAWVIRRDADYVIELPVGLAMAETALNQARRFVQRMLAYAQKGSTGEPTE